MNNNIKSPIISLNVYDIKSQKEKTHRVEGRPFCSLSYRKHGTVKLCADGKTLISKSGCITFIPKGQNYSTEIVEDTHMIAIHFNALDEKKYDKPFVIENINTGIYELFDSVLKNYSSENDNNFESFSYFYKILAVIEKHFIRKQEGKINPVIAKAKSMIDKNFSDPDFNIDSLVLSLPISASHLRSEFNKTYSISPIKYLKNVRLQNAISLLASDYYTIEEVSQKSGFGSTSYFIQSFSKSTGYSPQKYREKFLR
ncbi:MAG: helix-turn-helix transcriptional regulator [Clostridia bacterium]|nr:helix-turn-helix transcriptional regulator [Clostridia bacterium]